MSQKFKIFVDGAQGTTGLQLLDQLKPRPELELLSLSEDDRKNPAKKRAAMEEAEVAVLCLPDEAAKEVVQMVQGSRIRLIDASTAHRVHPAWVYGLPELGYREQIKTAQYVTNPGCYPTGFLLLVAPLVKAGILPQDAALSLHAVSGFSGGGKGLIQAYEAWGPGFAGSNTAAYALGLKHKHLPEMQTYAHLAHTPLFSPLVGGFPQGMVVQVPLFAHQFKGDSAAILACWEQAYGDEAFVTLGGCNNQDLLSHRDLFGGGFLDPSAYAGSNLVELSLWGNGSQWQLTARLDNLGKGASGACVQNLNLMLGLPEGAGL